LAVAPRYGIETRVDVTQIFADMESRKQKEALGLKPKAE
jgi:hypothetical protein